MSTFDKYSMENITKNAINDFFSTESILFKHRNTFDDEFYLSEVYQFCKKDIKYLKNFYKDLSTFSNYSLFLSYSEEKQQIFHISVDYSGTTLKKEKYFEHEDITLPKPFDICISVDLYRFPINLFPQNTLEKVLRPTFEFNSEQTTEPNNVRVKTLSFKSKFIETGSSTPEEIYNESLNHIINFQCLYKNDQIDGAQATKTSYTLQVIGEDDLFVLYHVEINREGETLHESKPFRVIPSPINSPYKVFILIKIYLDPLELDDLENERTKWLQGQAQDTINLLEVRVENLRKESEEIKTKTDLKNNLKCTKEETCCVCLSSPSKVLFSDCGHLCLCEECNNSLTTNHDFEEDFKCPMCRTKVSLPRIII